MIRKHTNSNSGQCSTGGKIPEIKATFRPSAEHKSTHHTIVHVPCFGEMGSVIHKHKICQASSSHLSQSISVKRPAVGAAFVLNPDVAPVGDAMDLAHFPHVLKHRSQPHISCTLSHLPSTQSVLHNFPVCRVQSKPFKRLQIPLL